MRRAAHYLILGEMVWAGVGCGGIGAAPEAHVADVPSHGPVGKTIKTSAEKFAACGRDSVAVQTGTSETIQLRFTINGQGKVEKAETESMTSPDPDLQTCVLRALKRLQFPVPKDRKSKEINYPLILKPE